MKSVRGVLLGLVVVLGGLFYVAYLFSVDSDCDRRNSMTPEFPIFPASTLESQEIIINQSWESAIIFSYVANDNYENIRSYFLETTKFCTEQFYNYRLFCPGEAQPFGEYEIRINQDTLPPLATNYSVYVRWNKCSSDTHIRFGTD